MVPETSNQLVARLRHMNPIGPEPAFTDVVLPVLQKQMPTDVLQSGPWTAARWAIDYAASSAFAEAVKPLHQGIHTHELTMSARRRYSMLVVPAAIAVGLEEWAAQGHQLSGAPAIELAVENAKALEEQLREWRDRPASPLLVPTHAETDAIIPLMALWQVAGVAVSDLAAKPQLAEADQIALAKLVYATNRRLPERAARLWSDVKPIILQDLGPSMHFGNWIGHGQFRHDPLDNPGTRGSEWSSAFVNEPLFLGIGRLAADIGRLAPALDRVLSSGPAPLPADERGTLLNLGDRESVFSAGRYFSPSVSYAPARADASPAAILRAGLDPHSALRVRALRGCYEAWQQKLMAKGVTINDAHLQKAAPVSRRFEESSWRELSEKKQQPEIRHDARLMLSQENPWGESGRALILAQLIPMFSVRLQTMRVILEAEEGIVPAALRDQLAKTPDLSDRLRQMHALGLVHRLSPRDVGEPLPLAPEDSRAYWRHFLTGQPNPYCGLTEPQSLISGLAPLAYARRLQTCLTAVWVPPSGDPLEARAAQEKLGSRIWGEAVRRVGACREPQSYEEAILGAALKAAHEGAARGFTPFHAFALSFSAAMGSGGDPRLPDCTEVANQNRARALSGKKGLDELLTTGSSAVVAQYVTDWVRYAKRANAAVHQDPRLQALARAIESTQTHLVEKGGKTSLGGVLKNPDFWKLILNRSPELDRFVAEVAAKPQERPGLVASAVAGAVGDVHPFVDPAFGTALKQIQTAAVNTQPMRLQGTPAQWPESAWGLGVLVNAVEEVAPMLDAFATLRGDRWMKAGPPQVALIEHAAQRELVPAPGQSAKEIVQTLRAEIAKAYPQFRFLPSAEEVSDVGQVSAVHRFLEAEGREHKSLFHQLTSSETLLEADQLLQANRSLYRVFQPRSNQLLNSNAQAVVWAASLRGALENAGEQYADLTKALGGFIDVHSKVMVSVGRSRPGAARSPRNHHDVEYAREASNVLAAFKEVGPLPAPILWHVRAQASGAVHAHLMRQARETERAHLGPTAEAKSRAAALGAVLVSTINTIEGAERFISNPKFGRARPALAAPEQTPVLPEPDSLADPVR